MTARAPRAYVLVDLGFGDAGKGLLTDYLVRRTGATLVVRYNGGAQAGHNVVTPDGRHHTFAQLGAGTFVPGVRTFLSRYVAVHPTALLVEAEALAAKGVDDPLSRLQISENAPIITPFHQAAGRLRELALGPERHGSCGVGVGEAVRDALERPEEAVVAGDLRGGGEHLRSKLARIRDRLQAEIEALGPIADRSASWELGVFKNRALLDRWLTRAVSLAERGLIVPDSTLRAALAQTGSVVFEGAQGVLLDEWAGFPPFTSWSRCTAENALALLAEAAPGGEREVLRIGVLRTHAVRHGPGPLPTETAELKAAVVEHNAQNDWQGKVRYGWFDAVLARYALDVAGPLDALALTHLDVPARLGRWRLCGGYEGDEGADAPADLVERSASGRITRLRPGAKRSLPHQERLTTLLAGLVPALEDCAPEEEAVLERTENLLGRKFSWGSRGPRSTDVFERP
jgi:adenylosuccinate synthase